MIYTFSNRNVYNWSSIKTFHIYIFITCNYYCISFLNILCCKCIFYPNCSICFYFNFTSKLFCSFF